MLINYNKRLFNSKYVIKINEAYDCALKLLKVPCNELEVNIYFVSKTRIKALNSQFRAKNSVTDVLSFPNLLEVGRKDMQLIVDKLNKKTFKSEINPENNYILLGDICICKAQVFKQAKEYNNTRLREMVYMAVHGLLHLLGYDHIKEDDKKVMREAEEKIMKRINLERK